MSEQQATSDEAVRCSICGDPIDLDDKDSHVNVACRWFICGDCTVEVMSQVESVMLKKSPLRLGRPIDPREWSTSSDVVKVGD